MRYVKLLQPLLVGLVNCDKDDIVLVNDERGADLIRTKFAVAASAPAADKLANPEVNRLQDAIDPAPPPTYAPLSEDGLTAHIARATALVVDDHPGLIALRENAQESPEHEATGKQVDAAAKVKAAKPADVPAKPTPAASTK